MKLYIYVTNIEAALKGDFNFSLNISSLDDLEGDGWIQTQALDIDINLDREEFTKKAVSDLDRQIKEVQATSHATVEVLKSRQQNLLALTNEKEE